MLLSYVISCFNASETIEYCLTSITEEVAGDYEVIVVDDGSTDNSMQLITNFLNTHPQNTIKVISQSNQGSASARNVGLKEASGEFVFFCDSDDAVFSTQILELCSEMSDRDIGVGNYTKSKTLGGTPYFISATDTEIPSRNRLEKDSWREKLVARKCWWTIVYRREFLTSENVKFLPTFEEAGGFFVLDDLFFLFQVFSLNPRILMSDRVVYRYTQETSQHDQSYLSQLKLQPQAARVYRNHIQSFSSAERIRATNFMINRLLGTFKLVSKQMTILEKAHWSLALMAFYEPLTLKDKLKLPLRITKMLSPL